MKRTYILILLLAFLLAITAVNAEENSTDVVQITDDDAMAVESDEKLGTTYFYDEETGDKYVDDTVDTYNVVKYYGDKSTKFRVEVYDNDYSPESGVYVQLGRDWDSLVEKRTDSNGVAVFPVNYKVGKHSVMTYIECEDYDDETPNYNYYLAKNTVTIKTTIPTKTVTKHINEKTKKFQIKFLNTKGKALAGKTVKVKVKGKTYSLKTNSKGIARIQVNFKKVGTYKMVAINPASGEKKTITVKITKKYKVRTVTAKVYNSKNLGLFSKKCTRLIKGDAVICFSEYAKNHQYPRGVNIEHWYVGNKNTGEDIEAHHTKLIKAKVFYKNSKGKVVTRTKKANKWGGFDSFSFVKGYTPYKAKVWYRDK